MTYFAYHLRLFAVVSVFTTTLILKGTGGDVTCSTLSGSPSWIAAKDYCYYWVTLDFSAVLNYGSNNYGKSNNIDHLLKACSKLKDGDKLYGITIERERFPSILGNVSIDLDDGKILHYVDTIFFCIKNDWIMEGKISSFDFLSTLFYHELLRSHRQTMEDKSSDSTVAQCVNQSLVGESCTTVIEGKKGFIPNFKVGLSRMYELTQFEVTDIIKKYHKLYEYDSYPANHLALKWNLSCKPRVSKHIERNFDGYLNVSECLVIATADFYHQQCCCDESMRMCRSLKNDLTVDPGLPMFFLKDKLDKPEELDKYALDKESVRVKYKKRLDELQNKKPSIVCALGTLQLKETFVQVFEIDVASPAGIRSCRSTYYYNKTVDGKPKITLTMWTAFGCTLARKTKYGHHYCQIHSLICPSQKEFPEDQMTVECCCDGNHLCNHDMNSYQAFNLLPLYMENPLCSRSISSFRFIFLSGPHQYCAVHYDFVLRKVVSLYINVNMDLPREGDYEAYQQLGCRFIEAKIRPHIPIHCKNEVYKRDDTLLGRLIYMCTCPGKALSERLNESACDVELEKKITGKAMADTKKIGAPSCYYINLITETENYAPTGIGMFLANNITVRSNESFWCYDQLILTESHGKLIANWSSGEVKVTMYPEIRETCIRMSTENGAYVCASFRSGAFCCCKNYNDIPCNKQKQIQSIIMQDLVPFHSVWVEKKEQLRHWQNFCIKPDRNTEKCKSPMGCYLVRHATSLRTVSTDLPAGCISNIDQPLLQKYPYLALCSNYLKNGFATRCFYTDTRDAVTNIPLVTCCCNKNRYNDCPLPAFTPMLGYTYNTSRNT